MKVDLKGFNTSQLSRIIELFRDTAIQATMGIGGHEYDKKSNVLTMPDCSAYEFITSPFRIFDYSVWLEIPSNLKGPIPETLFWAKKGETEEGETIWTNWEDAHVAHVGNNGMSLVHFGQHTANISKADVRTLFRLGISVIPRSDLDILLKNPNSQYYTNSEEII